MFKEFNLIIISFVVFLAEYFTLFFFSERDIVRTWTDSLKNYKNFFRDQRQTSPNRTWPRFSDGDFLSLDAVQKSKAEYSKGMTDSEDVRRFTKSSI